MAAQGITQDPKVMESAARRPREGVVATPTADVRGARIQGRFLTNRMMRFYSDCVLYLWLRNTCIFMVHMEAQSICLFILQSIHV